jgi:hypothetical protein
LTRRFPAIHAGSRASGNQCRARYFVGPVENQTQRGQPGILSGYAEGIKTAGQPFVLAERHRWLAAIALARLQNPARFWRKLEDFPEVRGQIPAAARKALENLMPESAIEGPNAAAPVLPVGYVVNASRIADRRMILAGYRLADLLTRVMGR